MAAESKRNIAALGQNASASKRYGLAIKDLGNAKLAQAKLDVLNTKQNNWQIHQEFMRVKLIS